MQRWAWLAFAIAVLGSAGTFWSLKPLLTYKPMLPGDVPLGTSREELKVIMAAKREEKRPASRSLSKAEANELEFDFGMMDPDQTLSHEFVVENIGSETLRLGDPKPGCSCATGTISSYEVAPGARGFINLEWNPSNKTGPFSVSRTVPTSDPDQAELRFVAKGTVRRRLDASPSMLTWGDIAPQAEITPRETTIFSEVWEQFEVERFECALAGFECAFTPLPLQELPAGAKAGVRLTANIPDNLPKGRIHEELRLWIRAAGEAEPLLYTMYVDGNVRGKLSIHGPGIDDQGLIDLGTFKRNEKRHLQFVVKVRDKDKHLPNARFQVEPSFVQATLTPIGDAGGLYTLHVVIPEQSPAGALLRPDQWGTLTLLTDHPRIPEMTMRLRFAITGREAEVLPP